MQYHRTPIFSIDDTILAERMRFAQNGDQQAYASVLENCRDAFSRLARERCATGASEQEIVRQCLLTVHHARHTFDPDGSFSAWVDGIARHHGISCAHVGRKRMWRAHLGMFFKGVIGIAVPPKTAT